jgi:protein ImuB
VCELERTDNVYDQSIKPAEPTLDARQLLDLVRLRLEAMPLPAPASSLTLEVTGLLVTAEQMRLMTSPPRRDLAAADRALARIIAELGPDAVTRAVLQDAHLPEASFRFERLDHVCFPRPEVLQQVQEPPAIRRVWAKPVEITSREHMTQIAGPYVICGGWWARQVTRHYYYVETESGDLLYCFYDAERDRFMVHGAL